MIQLAILVALVAANVYMGQMKLLTPYSKSQQDWTTVTLTEITLLYGGIVFYIIVANGLTDNELSVNGRRAILFIF